MWKTMKHIDYLKKKIAQTGYPLEIEVNSEERFRCVAFPLSDFR